MSTVRDRFRSFVWLDSNLLRGLVFWVPLFVSMYFAFTSRMHSITVDNSDIVLHAFAFIYLTTSLGFAYFRNTAWFLPAAWMLAYALFIECVQYFLPTRSFELGDIGVDVVSILIGLVLLHIVVLPLLDSLRSHPK